MVDVRWCLWKNTIYDILPHMKSPLAALLIGILVGISMLGFVGMIHGVQAHDGGCIAAMTQGMNCPIESNLADYLAFHFDALKKFSTAIFSGIAASLLILSLLVIAVAFGIPPRNLVLPQFAYYRLRRTDPLAPPSRYELIRWLALHENSPATP